MSKNKPCNGQRRKITKTLHEEIKSHVRFLIKVLIFTVLPVVTGDLKCKGEEFYFLFAFI